MDSILNLSMARHAIFMNNQTTSFRSVFYLHRITAKTQSGDWDKIVPKLSQNQDKDNSRNNK